MPGWTCRKEERNDAHPENCDREHRCHVSRDRDHSAVRILFFSGKADPGGSRLHDSAWAGYYGWNMREHGLPCPGVCLDGDSRVSRQRPDAADLYLLSYVQDPGTGGNQQPPAVHCRSCQHRGSGRAFHVCIEQQSAHRRGERVPCVRPEFIGRDHDCLHHYH